MKLGDWLKREKVTLEEFGLRIGRSHSAVSRYVSGERLPSKNTMELIFTETGGAVSPNDFYDNAPLSGDPSRAGDEEDERVAAEPHAA